MRSRGWIATTIGFAILAAAWTGSAATPSRQQEARSRWAIRHRR